MVAALAGYAWLHGDAGEAWLLRKILASTDASIRGTLTARHLEIHGLSWSALDLALRTPSGRVVATAERLEGLPLLPLARGKLVFDGARLVGLAFDAQVTREGVDAVRALAPRPSQRGGGHGFVLRALDIELRGGTLSQRDWPAAPPRLSLGPGRARITRASQHAPVVYGLDALARAPLQGPLGVSVSFGSTGGVAQGVASVVAPGLRLEARGRASPPWRAVWRLELGPDAGRLLLARWPVAVPLVVDGEARRAGAGAALTLSASSPAGRLDGAGRVEAGAVAGARLTFRDVDLERLVASGPATHLTGTVDVETVRWRGGRLAGAVAVALGPGRIGPARFDAGEVRASAGAAAGVEGEVRVSGVRGAGASAARVAATVHLAPGWGRAHVAARGDDVRVRGRAARAVIAVADLTPRALVAHVDAGSVEAGLAARRAGDALHVAALRIRWPGALWVLDGQGLVAARSGGGLVDLRLRSGRQRVAVSAVLDRSDVAARVRVDRLALARLPLVSLPAATLSARADVRGDPADPRVDARAAVRRLPTGAGSAAIDAGVRRAPGGSVHLEGHVAARGAPSLAATFRADLRPEAHGARVSAEVRPRRGGRVTVEGSVGSGGRLALDAVASALDPAPLAALLPGVRTLSGRVDGRARVVRDGGAPSVEGRLTWRHGAASTRGYGSYADVELALAARGDAWTLERLEVRTAGGTLRARGAGERRGARVDVDLEARAERFPVIWGWRYLGRATGRIEARAAIGEKAAIAAIDAPALRIDAPATLGEDVQDARRPEGVVVVRGAAAPPQDEGPRAAPRAWRIALQAPRGVRVRGQAFDLTLAISDPFLVGLGRQTTVHGAVRVARGALDLLGSPLHVLAGAEVRFSGRPDAPFVDIGAASALGGGLVVRASTARPGSMWDLSTQSEGALLRALARRRAGSAPPVAQSPTSPSDRSTLARWIASQIPLATLLDPTLATGTKEVRTAVTGRLTVGVIERPAADTERGQDRRETRVGLVVAPDLHLEGRFGERDGSLDFFWQPRIGGRRDVGERAPRVRARGAAPGRRRQAPRATP